MRAASGSSLSRSSTVVAVEVRHHDVEQHQVDRLAPAGERAPPGRLSRPAVPRSPRGRAAGRACRGSPRCRPPPGSWPARPPGSGSGLRSRAGPSPPGEPRRPERPRQQERDGLPVLDQRSQPRHRPGDAFRVRRDRPVVAHGRQPDEPAHCLSEAVERRARSPRRGGRRRRRPPRRAPERATPRRPPAARGPRREPRGAPGQLARLAGVLEQHLAVADDVVERRAQLVAEVREAGGVGSSVRPIHDRA